MLCCTSLLSSVLRSAALGLRRAVLCCAVHLCSDLWLGLKKAAYAVLQICAFICTLTPGWGLRRLLYALLQICALVPCWALGELLYAELHISAVSVL